MLFLNIHPFNFNRLVKEYQISLDLFLSVQIADDISDVINQEPSFSPFLWTISIGQVELKKKMWKDPNFGDFLKSGL